MMGAIKRDQRRKYRLAHLYFAAVMAGELPDVLSIASVAECHSALIAQKRLVPCMAAAMAKLEKGA
jgi:hypothetical protein